MQLNNISTDIIENELTLQKNIRLDILRLDKIHPVVSGNKWFKLQYYLTDAVEKGYNTLLTFGGAYSNHIIATAYAAKASGLKAVGVIRGEEPVQWSHTLREAATLGMQLVFLSRKAFQETKRDTSSDAFTGQFGKVYIIPEGGFGSPGARGAAGIADVTDTGIYTHIVSAVGTGTTAAGMLLATGFHQQVVGISAMKNNFSLKDEIQHLINAPLPARFHLLHDYHFGGFAKYTPELITFMNRFYHTSTIPLDRVYTAKMFYGIFDLMKKDFFPPRSHVLAIHSGGLQGNRSLKPGVLEF